MKVLIDKTVDPFNRNDYATFISIVFENLYMVKLVCIPGSGSTSGPRRVQRCDIFILVSEPRFRRFYKLIFEIVCDMHCIFI